MGTEFPTIPGTDFVDIESMITPAARKMFEEAKKAIANELMLTPEEIAKVEEEGRQNNKTPVFPVSITFIGVRMRSFYGSPFPDEFLHLKTVFACDFCMKFFAGQTSLDLHLDRVCTRAPPGVEIYRKGNISIFEVNGNEQKAFCQNLCLVSRLWLQSKTVDHDTEHFMFYVLTVNSAIGCQVAGYFSREMYWPPAFTMMCVLVLPSHKGKGYGTILIALSYEMAYRQGLELGPETPLSPEGHHAHEQFWKLRISKVMNLEKIRAEVAEGVRGVGFFWRIIATNTGIQTDDIADTFVEMNCMKALKPTKKEKRKGIETFVLDMDWDVVDRILKAEEDRKQRGKDLFDWECVDWEPQEITPQMNGFDTYERRRREDNTDGNSEEEEAEETNSPPKKKKKRNHKKKKNKKKSKKHR